MSTSVLKPGEAIPELKSAEPVSDRNAGLLMKGLEGKKKKVATFLPKNAERQD